MGNMIPYNGILFVPTRSLGITFHEKEECSLNAFQNFLIDAIDRQATINQMTDATKLSEHVIRSEINQLLSQKLLDESNGMIKLSALSQHLLLVARVVRQLNEEAKRVTINLITGELSPYIPAELNGPEQNLSDQIEDSQLVLSPLISDWEIQGMSLENEEISDFFRSYMDAFSEMTEEEVSDVLNSLYIELEIRKGENISYQPLKIQCLPCLPSQEELENLAYRSGGADKECSDAPTPFGVEGTKVTFAYGLESRFLHKNMDLFPHLSFLYQMDTSLLSKHGLEYIEKYNDHSSLVKRKFICTLDTVSGEYTLHEDQEGAPTIKPQEINGVRNSSGKPDSRRKICLNLPMLCDLATFDQAKVIAELRNKFYLPDDIEVILEDSKEETYVTVSSLDELQTPCMRGGEDNGL